jgi:catechol 2,3-dioxygenase-like lactoylglutathione lyase family enzyme
VTEADNDIDLPLDENPDTPPEETPAAEPAMSHGLVTPPPAVIPQFVPPPREKEASPPEPTVPAQAAPPRDESTDPVITALDMPPAPLADQTAADQTAADQTAADQTAADQTPANQTPANQARAREASAGMPDAEGSTAEMPLAAAAGAAADATATGASDAAAPKSPAAETPAGLWADLEGGYEPDDRADDVITAYPSARPGPAGAIHGVGLTVLVTDLERSVGFYHNTLGFYEIDKGEGNAVLASGDTRLVLRTVSSLSAAGRLIYLNLEVGDVQAVYRELVGKGVTFEHPPQVVNHGEKLELLSATFHDPDGHSIAITQWRATR